MIDAILALYAQGKTCAQIAKLTGKSTMTVHRMIKKSGIEMRKYGDLHRGREWSEARRAHHPAKPVRAVDAPRGYDILTQRALGNKSVSKHGYVVIRTGRKKRQYEHILVAEKALGRPLEKGMVVHHINCNRQDNRPENLLVCSTGYHLALHARMRRDPYWKQF